MGALLDDVAKRLETEQRWAEIESAYARLERDDPAAWNEYLTELAEWDTATSGGDTDAAEDWPEYNR